jgi:tRNA pseudouridine55 synthase
MVQSSRPAGARARWRDVDGILLLDKPAAISSNQALQRVRRALQAAKAGHAGTLDPMATGMLPLCFGQATKACGQLLGSTKAYRATVTFGAATDTGDADGQVIAQAAVPPLTADSIDRVLAGLMGDRTQVPPMYSALKRDGRPLYELARRGVEVERAARRIRIESLARVSLQGASLEFEVVCSKGTYVRVLAEEIAAALGTRGHLSQLRRLWVEPFCDGDMVGLETIERWVASGGWEHGPPPALLPVDRAFPDLPRLDLSGALDLSLRQGRALDCAVPALEPGGLMRVYGPGAVFLGLAVLGEDGRVRVQRLFVPGAGTQGPENS